MDAIKGKHGECYGKFLAYANVVRYHNLGSLLKLQFKRLHTCSNPSFKNFFVCVEAMKTGFINRCRPFLGLDGCHLKEPYGGVLLGAVALDGNHKGCAGDGVISRGKGSGRVSSSASGVGGIGLGKGRGREGGNAMPGDNATGIAGRSGNGRARGMTSGNGSGHGHKSGSGMEWA
ncbi:hypothetical protein L1049_012345 [Liquidambar formosana]|uniref:Uncharacterized protein n=1 Tax=Liquidambar formosana TaxID=63359 RepID=A0AAP0RSU0_LIQFO